MTVDINNESGLEADSTGLVRLATVDSGLEAIAATDGLTVQVAPLDHAGS